MPVRRTDMNPERGRLQCQATKRVQLPFWTTDGAKNPVSTTERGDYSVGSIAVTVTLA